MPPNAPEGCGFKMSYVVQPASTVRATASPFHAYPRKSRRPTPSVPGLGSVTSSSATGSELQVEVLPRPHPAPLGTAEDRADQGEHESGRDQGGEHHHDHLSVADPPALGPVQEG